MSAIATSVSDVNNVNEKTCTTCSLKLSVPNKHDDTIVIVPPSIITTHKIPGNFDSLCSNRTRR